ncbi:hypothetical protein DFJ74DRAFT_758430 [Hyaloraphidium curvatum]|nr:hypothetical protein DFJ74DRAFT_758430 [Hyaloraphidium curvatum]
MSDWNRNGGGYGGYNAGAFGGGGGNYGPSFGGGGGNYGGNYGGDNYGGGNVGGGGNRFGGGGGGGGFGAGGFSPGAQGSPGEKKQSRLSNQTLRPLTCKQLAEATQPIPDQNFQLDGAEIGQFALVGRILAAQAKSTNLTYTVEDGTGQMDFTVWFNKNEDPGMREDRGPEYPEGTYVKIIGNIKSFQGKRSYVSQAMRKVENFNEVTAHELECISVTLYHRRGPPSANQVPAGDHANPYVVPPVGLARPTGANPYAQAPAGGGIDPSSNLHPTAQRVMAVVHRSPDTNEGVHVQTIVAALRGQGIAEGEVRTQVQWLMDEGHLYSTVDDEHVKLRVPPPPHLLPHLHLDRRPVRTLLQRRRPPHDLQEIAQRRLEPEVPCGKPHGPQRRPPRAGVVPSQPLHRAPEVHQRGGGVVPARFEEEGVVLHERRVAGEDGEHAGGEEEEGAEGGAEAVGAHGVAVAVGLLRHGEAGSVAAVCGRGGGRPMTGAKDAPDPHLATTCSLISGVKDAASGPRSSGSQDASIRSGRSEPWCSTAIRAVCWGTIPAGPKSGALSAPRHTATGRRDSQGALPTQSLTARERSSNVTAWIQSGSRMALEPRTLEAAKMGSVGPASGMPSAARKCSRASGTRAPAAATVSSSSCTSGSIHLPPSWPAVQAAQFLTVEVGVAHGGLAEQPGAHLRRVALVRRPRAELGVGVQPAGKVGLCAQRGLDAVERCGGGGGA